MLGLLRFKPLCHYFVSSDVNSNRRLGKCIFNKYWFYNY